MATTRHPTNRGSGSDTIDVGAAILSDLLGPTSAMCRAEVFVWGHAGWVRDEPRLGAQHLGAPFYERP